MNNLLNSPDPGLVGQVLRQLYGHNPAIIEVQTKRYDDLIAGFRAAVPSGQNLELFSTPGRIEVGGNHTDHNAGRVLAAAVDLDIIAAAAKNESAIIRIYSVEFPPVEIDISDLELIPKEQFTPAALVRGVCACLEQSGYRIGGFDAFTSSNVPIGSGLSSSAAFEVLVVIILNHFYNDGRIDNLQVAKTAHYAENVYFGKPCGLMDQIACTMGGLMAIDFQDFENPLVSRVNYDFNTEDYSIVVVSTGGDHADLHEDYIALQNEMKSVAREMGGQVLRELSRDQLLRDFAAIRSQVNDRAILRAIHFYAEHQRVLDQIRALETGDFANFLQLAVESGQSSWMLCQNVYSCRDVERQGLAVALALSKELLAGHGAWRVQGGGFAGTIQAYVPDDLVAAYIQSMEDVFGPGSCSQVHIRPTGSTSFSDLVSSD